MQNNETEQRPSIDGFIRFLTQDRIGRVWGALILASSIMTARSYVDYRKSLRDPYEGCRAALNQAVDYYNNANDKSRVTLPQDLIDDVVRQGQLECLAKGLDESGLNVEISTPK